MALMPKRVKYRKQMRGRMRGKAYRRHKARAKWIERVKKWMPKGVEYKWEDGVLIQWHPTYKDCMKEPGFKVYKTTGKPCSCFMCSYYRYSRVELKKDTKFQLKNSA